MMTRKHFRRLAEIIKTVPDRGTRTMVAEQVAGMCRGENERFDTGKFMDAAGCNEEEGGEE